MSNEELVVVELPHLRPTVALPPELADLLEHLIEAGPHGEPVLGLMVFGVKYPAEKVAKLQSLGAIIRSENPCGNLMNYTYMGWQ